MEDQNLAEPQLARRYGDFSFGSTWLDLDEKGRGIFARPRVLLLLGVNNGT